MEGDEVLDLIGRCLEIHETDGAEAAEAFCDEHPEHSDELRRRLALLREAGLLTESAAGAGAFPERLGDFQLIEPIGGGGMGVVYRARQVSLDREVGLKLVRPDQVWLERARERFRREVEAVAGMHHPGIVPVHAVGEEEGLPWFAMELVRGCTLAEAMTELSGRNPAALTGADLARVVSEHAGEEGDVAGVAWTYEGSWFDTCCRIVALAADALDHAHRRGVLHRDVKPANLMLTPDGRVMLVDFGIARNARDDRMTQTGAQVGTLGFMAPEQVRGEDVDARADVYSLGVTLYEMLTLSRAFAGESTEIVLRRIREGDCAAPRRRVAAVPWDADVVCRVAMDPDRERRYETAAALRRDLEAVLERRPIEARRPGAALRVKRWVQRHPTATVACVLGFLLVVVGPLTFALREMAARQALQEAYDQTDAQRVRAESNYDDAVAALAVVTDIAQRELRTIPGLDGVRNRILGSVLAFHLSLVEQRADDPRARWEVVQALGAARGIAIHRGQHRDARALADRAVEEMLAIVAEDPSSRHVEGLVAAFTGRAHVANAADRYSDALGDLREAMVRLEHIGLDPGPSSMSRDSLRAEVLHARAVAWRALGRKDDAKGALREAIVMGSSATYSPSYGTRRRRARAAIELARLEGATGEKHVKHAADTLKELIAERPGDYDVRTSLASALSDLGTRAAGAKRHDESLALQREALVHVGRLARDFPNVLRFQMNLAVQELNVGVVHANRKEASEAFRNLDAAVDRLRPLMAMKPDDLALVVLLGSALTARGPLRDPAEALDDLEEAAKLLTKAVRARPENERWVYKLRGNAVHRADCYMKTADHESASETAAVIRDLAPDNAWDAYVAARVFGNCAQTARRDDTLDADERTELVTRYVDAALDALSKAADRGFDRGDLVDRTPHLRTVRADPRFEKVRRRLDR